MGEPLEPTPLTFRPRQRLTHARQFQAVYDAKMRKSRGGLIVFSRPNDLPNHRLGLAVSARTIAKATSRNRVKRLVREWFRLSQHQLATLDNDPGAPSPAHGLDIIVSIRTERALPLAALSVLLSELVAESAGEWRRRTDRNSRPVSGNEAAGPFPS